MVIVCSTSAIKRVPTEFRVDSLSLPGQARPGNTRFGFRVPTAGPYCLSVLWTVLRDVVFHLCSNDQCVLSRWNFTLVKYTLGYPLEKKGGATVHTFTEILVSLQRLFLLAWSR